MYKCVECGAEYKTKPDYCDCGNDRFETIEEKKKDYSILFLLLCVILSVVILSFSTDNKDNKITKTIPEPVQTPKQIPQPKSQPKAQQPKQKPKQSKQQPQQQPQPKSQAKSITQQKTIVKPKPVIIADTKEAQNYKIRLRNALFLKLNVANIQGSGKCGIQFAVNSEGKLINRAFSFQSDNKTLNDEVYKMLMRMPRYDTPPKSYKGELIKITIEFNNGEYEILLL